jgi:cytochrome b subunit of formate dehydrogenase
MSKRTTMVFWTAVATAVLLLGGGIATARQVLAGGTVGDYVALSLALIGVAAALLVASRIVFVWAGVQHRARRS